MEFNNVSRRFKAGQATSTSASGIAVPERIQNLTANVMCDVNQAIRFGIEYDYVHPKYPALAYGWAIYLVKRVMGLSNIDVICKGKE